VSLLHYKVAHILAASLKEILIAFHAAGRATVHTHAGTHTHAGVMYVIVEILRHPQPQVMSCWRALASPIPNASTIITLLATTAWSHRMRQSAVESDDAPDRVPSAGNAAPA
jgi:hypothetical protein